MRTVALNLFPIKTLKTASNPLPLWRLYTWFNSFLHRAFVRESFYSQTMQEEFEEIKQMLFNY